LTKLEKLQSVNTVEPFWLRWGEKKKAKEEKTKQQTIFFCKCATLRYPFLEKVTHGGHNNLI